MLLLTVTRSTASRSARTDGKIDRGPRVAVRTKAESRMAPMAHFFLHVPRDRSRRRGVVSAGAMKQELGCGLDVAASGIHTGHAGASEPDSPAPIRRLAVCRQRIQSVPGPTLASSQRAAPPAAPSRALRIHQSQRAPVSVDLVHQRRRTALAVGKEKARWPPTLRSTRLTTSTTG